MTNAVTKKRNRVAVRFTLTLEEARVMRELTEARGVSMANFARTLTLAEIGLPRAAKSQEESS